MNILYIAYSCAPYKGSENKIGWNVSCESSKNNRVSVITKEEHREAIEGYMREHSNPNIHFYYVDIPNVYKYVCKGFLYSGRLNIWHKRAFKTAKSICARENIKIIHQITPIEFRSIGRYGEISNIKFVAGPLGGAESIPKGLIEYAKGHMGIEHIRTFMNLWCKFKYKLNGKLDKCDYLMYANQETNGFLEGSTEQMVTSEIAIDPPNANQKARRKSDKCIFLCAGRLIYRKGHDLLFDALEKLPYDAVYECRIVGKGPELERLKRRCEQNEKLKSHVVFTGAVPFTAMKGEYQNADVFLMPSIRETTGSVVLEAMAQGVPVVTIDKFGGAIIVDNETGWLYSGNTKYEYIQNLSDILLDCILHPEAVKRKGLNAAQKAEEYTWDNKLKLYNEIYATVVREADDEMGGKSGDHYHGLSD